MSTAARLFFHVIAACTGLSAGWMAGTWSQHPATKPAPPPAAAVAAAPSASASEDQPSRAPSFPGLLALPRLDTAEACLDFLRTLDQSAASRHPWLARHERSYALRCWLELDAESALAEAELRGDAAFGMDLFRAWLNLNPGSALDAFTQASPALTAKLRDSFFPALAEKNPAQAAEALVQPRWKFKAPPAADTTLRAVYQKWAQSDPQAALAHAEAHSPANHSPHMSAFAARGWAATDPEAAWRFFKEEKKMLEADASAVSRGAVLQALLAGALKAGPSGAALMEEICQSQLAPLLQGEGLARRMEELKFGEIARSLAQEDPRAALTWAQNLPENALLRAETLTAAARQLASAEPEYALGLLKETGGSKSHWVNESVLREAFAALHASAPERAFELLTSLSSEERRHAAGGILTHAFSADPAAAIEQTRAWLADPDMKEAALTGWHLAFSWGHGSGTRDPGPLPGSHPGAEPKRVPLCARRLGENES